MATGSSGRPRDTADGPTTILVAVDGSTTSLRAAAYAAGLARRQHSRLLLITVFSPPSLGGLMPQAISDAARFAAEAEDELRTTVRDALVRLGLHAEIVAAQGDPLTEIRRSAEKHRVDAVVVGASTSFGHRFAGSLAERLVRTGTWPVTVVP